MSVKFSSAYEAAELAATYADRWTDERGNTISADELFAMMSVADEEGEVDEEDEDFYYIVLDDGTLGFTSNAERSVEWLATATRAAKPQKAPEPVPAGKRAKTESRADRPHGAVGFSTVTDTPAYKEAVKKNKRTTLIFTLVLLLLPIALVSVITLITGELEFIYGLFIGACLSAALFVIYLLGSLGSKLQKPWEGLVEERYEKDVRVIIRHASDKNYNFRKQYYTVFLDSEGKRHKVVERDPVVYSYFGKGDKVRYHGRQDLLFPYEKYDKSKDESVICVFCARKAPVVDDDCPHCHRPLLK